MRRFITSFLLLFVIFQCYGQLTVSRVYPNNNINYLVKNILLGNGVLASNITFSGDDTAIGFFNGISSNIGIDSGVLITNCAVTNAPGPNNSSNAGYSWPRCGTYHDSDLATLIGVAYNKVHSAAILEFDFVPYSDTVSFQYVFASEEYPEFVGSQFNDDFGFFVSGPGISGPYSRNAENIALIPFTSTPVAINNVNCTMNYNYYVCNWPATIALPCDVGCPTSSSMPSTTVQFDGFTVPLAATAIVECGKQYHIKLAIANIGDCAYGSGVFLKSGSFSSSGTTVSSAINYSNSLFAGDTILYRGNCDQASIYFERGSSILADTIFIDTSGTASPGKDYTPIPDTIIMPPGVTGDTLNISAFASSKTGIQTIILSILQKSCGTVDTQKITLYIGNPDSIKVNQTPIIVCYGNNVTISPTITGGVGAYTYSWNTGATTSSISVNNIIRDTSFVVRILDACSDTLHDTIHVRPSSLIPLHAFTRDTVIFCPDTALYISVLAKGGSPAYTYLWSNGGTTSSVNVSSSSTKTYTVNITDSCGTVIKDSLTVTVTSIPLIIRTKDTTINCLGPATISAFASGGGGGYSYLWNNGATSSTITVKPLHDSTYVVTVTSPCGTQVKKDSVKVTVDTKPLTVITSSSQILCPGDIATITAHATGTGSISYTWIGIGTGPAREVKPTITTTYTVSVYDSCGNQYVTDTVTVFVPVLTPMSSSIYPDTITVCKEDIVNLFANATGGNGIYSYQWFQIGLFSDTLFNADSAHAYLHGNTTAVYRVLIKDGCGDTTSNYVMVDVIPDCNLIIPNVITPNGDNKNDYFYITNLDKYPDSELQIFDRWGKKVFESSNYQNNWEGTNNSGEKLSDGVYYYILYLSNGKKYPGFVQLIR